MTKNDLVRNGRKAIELSVKMYENLAAEFRKDDESRAEATLELAKITANYANCEATCLRWSHLLNPETGELKGATV